MATLEQQIELEYKMVQSGIDRYNKQLTDLLGKELGSKTKHGRTIIKGVIEPIVMELEKHMDSGSSTNKSYIKKIKGMDLYKVVYLALIALIDTLAGQHTLMKVATSIGIQIETQKRLDEWLKQDKDTAKNIIRLANKKSDKGFDHKRHGIDHKITADGLDIPQWSKQVRVGIGVRLVDLIIKTTGLAKLSKKVQKKKTVYFVVPTSETEEWIKKFNETNEIALPRFCPCIIEPRDWDSFWGGGYYSEHINKLPFVRIHA